MSRILFIVAVLGLCLAEIPTGAQNDVLRSGFKNPPASAKPRTWWHWVNGNVSKEGITADLEAMKRVGIQEAQLFNVDLGYPEGPAAYLSPKWLDLFHFAVSEAKRLGLEIGFHNSAGWSSSGGPWVSPEHGMQTVVFSEVRIKGDAVLHQKLVQPAAKFNYYKDIAVIAFPTPAGNQRIDELSLKALSGNAFRTHMDPDDKVIERSALVRKADIVDLSSRMSADGTLDWKAPSGDWIILRFGHTPNGTENHPAGSGGRGLECDKMSRFAVDAYWAGGVKPVLDKLGPLVGSSLTNCLIDSYEVGCNNWTVGFAEEFRKRRSYDCITFLPELAGYYVESGEIAERFLWDFRKTVSDLIAENYYGYFRELCHKSGMKFSVEPYGGPFESMKAGASGDVVMGEFWIGNKLFLESPRLAASISHLKGNSIVGAEAFTSFGGWLNHPATLKAVGDQVWAEGVNRFLFHTYIHQPWNIGPGMTFGVYGMEMNRLNTWWEQSRGYMDYVARSQFLLQQGRNVAYILVFTGESAPNDALLRSDIKAFGYDYDQIGPDELALLTVKDGIIYTRSGGPYRRLLLPDSKWATPELLMKIRALAGAGAVISGTKPVKSPGLQGYPDCDVKVAKLADEIWNGNLVSGSSVARPLDMKGLSPDFSASATGSDLNFIHRKVGLDDIYFVSSSQSVRRTELCRFRDAGRKPEFWNPETGKVEDVLVWQNGPGNSTEIPITFDANGSVFVVFRGGSAAHDNQMKSADQITSVKTELGHQILKPLAGLKILKAEYGTFLPEGMVDVTDVLIERMAKGTIRFSADNALAGGDPAAGSLKELRAVYEMDGQRKQLRLQENEHLDIKADKKGFRLIRALYGKFPPGFENVPPKYPIYDFTEKVRDLVAANMLVFPVTDSLFGKATSGDGKKELRLTYLSEGETYRIAVQTGGLVHLELDTPEPRLVRENGVLTWVTPRAGKITYRRSSGLVKTATVTGMPKPVELTGPWELSFPPNLGAPQKTVFPQLISWPLADEEGIRYFSGTAVYRKKFVLKDDLVREGNSLELDLGTVGVIAEVFVNGKNLSVIWKAPFRVELGDVVRKGKNQLEIRVTNLWPNRLIGDARIPDDVKWKNDNPETWPDWLSKPAERDSKRVTFTSHKFWDERSHLTLSGLLGPVMIRSYQHVKLKE
ncbi:MAG TPA: glycosyl hydrolase [Pedobacter sp.]|uniref:glycosyl hydrolase n=1 Tax=Pedobacter sp. TaxID=1411316 RepID=UPI002D0D5A4C|nr:glycosyl hydrolase [Pedobacter sp.]HMI01938.1 glycosyl hydrolase [Pedobacter sp.]